MIIAIVSVFGILGLISWIGYLFLEHKSDQEMYAKSYRREFVISCSADPGSWQWVKKHY